MPRWKSFDHAKRSVHILVGSKYCEPFLGKMGVHVLLQLNMMRHSNMVQHDVNVNT